MPTLVFRRTDGSELFRDDRDYRNFRYDLTGRQTTYIIC